jgi:Flp pilus assembly protein TadG
MKTICKHCRFETDKPCGPIEAQDCGWYWVDTPRRLARDLRASIAVEFALLFPIMILAVAGGVDFGLAITARYQLIYGTGQAAIAQMSGNDPAPVFASNSPGAVTCTLAPDGQSVTCTATYTYPAIFSGLLGFANLPLSATATAAKVAP